MVAESEIEPLFEHTVEYIDILGACNLGVDELTKNKDGLMLFPNPAADKTTIKFEAKGKTYTLQVIDMNGRIVIEPFSGKKLSGEHIIPIDLHSLQSGFYMVRLLSESGEKSAKLIVTK